MAPPQRLRLQQMCVTSHSKASSMFSLHNALHLAILYPTLLFCCTQSFISLVFEDLDNASVI
jgi:hypothetical protein